MTAVDIWLVPTDGLVAADVARARALMTAEEVARGARFVREIDRDVFALTRALIRTTLSRYAPTPPLDWRFVVNAYKCPFIDAPQAGHPPLHFNVSHTGGLVALAVVRGHRVGVDVECLDRQVTEGIPERHFAPEEVRDLAALPHDRQALAFFDYWTLKEAYIKARGMGLAIPLDQFAFTLHDDRAPSISFVPGFDDDASRWQFWQATPTPSHRLGLAVEQPDGDLAVTLRHLPPAALAL